MLAFFMLSLLSVHRERQQVLYRSLHAPCRCAEPHSIFNNLVCPSLLQQAVTVATSSVVSLLQAVGVSSSFVAQKTQGGKEGREELLSVEEFDYWNLWDFKGVLNNSQ
jgi:hypothetical protein